VPNIYYVCLNEDSCDVFEQCECSQQFNFHHLYFLYKTVDDIYRYTYQTKVT